MKAYHNVQLLPTMLFLFLFSVSWSQETVSVERSLNISQNDPNLAWGPCPEFMPQGCSLAVLHGNPAERNADLFLKIPANSVIPNHTHTSAERMLLVAGELEVTYEGEQPQLLKAGNYAYGPANKAHIAKCGDTPCLLFIAFEEPVDAIPKLAKI